MQQLEIDHGVRCERHVGEVFRVRCEDCDQAAAEYAADVAAALARGPEREHRPQIIPGDSRRPVRSLAKAAGRVR